MAVKLRRPILVGGVGLSFSLWLLHLHHSVAELGEFSMYGTITVCMVWLLRQSRTKDAQIQLDSLPVDRVTVEKVIAQAEAVVSQLKTEAENYVDPMTVQVALALLQEKVAQLSIELDRQEIKIAITGGKGVGKSTLLQVLKTNWSQQQQCWQETPALFTGTDTDLKVETAALEVAIASDLVLFVTDGDLTDSEFQTLQQLTSANQRVMLVLNKQDQYLSDERAIVLHSLRQRMCSILGAEDVLAIAASPIPIKVRQHQLDGSIQEWMAQPEPEIANLIQHLAQIVVDQGQQLVWATTLRTSVALKAEAKTLLNGVRRDRALPVIEQYQWIAAAAAFANPVPALDLLAAVAINAQMVMELGAIYQQKFSLQQAQSVAGTMGSLILKLGLVEFSTKAISTVLKSNAITFVAGGLVQGVSAAYLTRLAGLSLIDYFQQQEVATDAENQLNLDKLGQTLQNVFQQNQQLLFLQGFVKQGVGRLLPKFQPQPTSGEVFS